MEGLVVLKPEDHGLTIEKGSAIQKAFDPKIAEYNALQSVYENLLTKEMSPEVCEEAKALRKKFMKVRTGSDKIHKAEKQYIVATGKYIDACRNVVTVKVKDVEETLLGMENHYVNIEKEKFNALNKERAEKIAPYMEDADSIEWATMKEDVYETYFDAQKKKHTEKVALQLMEAEAAEIEEAARATENARLKDEIAELRAENQKTRVYEVESEGSEVTGVTLTPIGETVNFVSAAEADLESFKNFKSDIEKLADKYVMMTDNGEWLYKQVGTLIERTVSYINDHEEAIK